MENRKRADGGNLRYDYYTNQMNIVVFVDVRKVLRTKSGADAVWLYDNTGTDEGNGTTRLASLCKPGTVVNWLVYSLDMERRVDGTWPPMAQIRNIVFLDADGGNASRVSPFEELKIFGGPDKVRSMYTPAYSYWSGNVRMDIGEGRCPYRLVIGVDDAKSGTTFNFDVDGASLQITAVDRE